MREEYNISELNPRKNPYTNRLKKQITININEDTIEYFKAMSERTGVSYQTLINMYLMDCMETKRELKTSWA